jgi:hypothetical protein
MQPQALHQADVMDSSSRGDRPDSLRKKNMPFLERVPLYPSFFALYAVLTFAAANVNELEISDILRSAIFLSLLAAGLHFGVLWLTHSPKKAMLTFVLIPWLLFYGYWNKWGLQLFENVFFPLVTWLCLGYVIIKTIGRSRSTIENNTKILNILSSVIMLIPALMLSYNEAVHYTKAKHIPTFSLDVLKAGQAISGNSNSLPDIYYIVPDRYASNIMLKEYYHYDNSEFLRFLSNKGFYVASKSYSNYPKTLQSLTSSLNFEYLDAIGEAAGRECADWRLMLPDLRNNRVMRFLKERGYRTYHFGSWWGPTDRNPRADANIKFGLMNEFEAMLYRMTPVGFLDDQYLHMADFTTVQCARVREKFERLRGIGNEEGPKFIFAHFLLPHPPFVLTADGRCCNNGNRGGDISSGYLEQLKYANLELQKTIETILARETRPVIIVIQADEGPRPTRYAEDEDRFDWRQATPDELRQKMGILNAYYFPRQDYEPLREDISPVNTFRVIFNNYFGTNLNILPDKSFAFVNHGRIYDWFPVSDKLRGLDQ